MIPESALQMVGRASEPFVLEVEKGAIKKFADAVGDYSPLYWDEEYARNSRNGGIVAPPGFFGWPATWRGAMPFFNAFRTEVMAKLQEAGYGRLLDGGIDYEFFQPVRAGDTLVGVMKFADIYERAGKSSSMAIAVFETTYTNQNGARVAVARQSLIMR